MNLKAKTEWRRSGERAGASPGHRACHSLLLLSSSCRWLSLAILPCLLLEGSLSSENFPFSRVPAVVLNPAWVLVHYGSRALAGRGSYSRFLPLLALLLSLCLSLMEDSLLGAAQCTCFLPDPLKKRTSHSMDCHPPQLASSHPSILRDKSQRPPMSQVPVQDKGRAAPSSAAAALFPAFLSGLRVCLPGWFSMGGMLSSHLMPPSALSTDLTW
jgi:hypothetical protein